MTGAPQAVFRPYLPRLALDWEARMTGTGARVLDASLLGLDISGFTALSERLAVRGKLGAEELITLISRCYSGLIEIATRQGGDTLKFRGDALLLLFDGAGHEARATSAAVAMQAFIGEAGLGASSVGPVELAMAGGIASGPTHLFLVGTHHKELIVCGPNATATLELEDAAEKGEILMSARTAEALPQLTGEQRGAAFLVRAEVDAAGLPAEANAEDAEPWIDSSLLVPPPLRAPIQAGAIEAEHRHAVAAFVKFRGTDSLVNDQVAAQESLTALATVVSDVCNELDITWLESDIDRDGGKLYLVAGAPASAGGDEERMLRAARTIVDAQAGPPIAIGINRGPVLAGPIGSPSRRTYAVMGDTVNLAARLAARAEQGEILATGDVLQRSRARFSTTARQFLMKGKEKPVTGHSVGALLDGLTEVERAPLPLVGRDEELAVIQAAVDRARLRESAAIELVGEAGIGKSRLVEELPRVAVGFQLLQARCEEYTASTPFGPFPPLLRPLVGILLDDPPDVAGAKLIAFVSSVMPDLAPWVPLLALPFDADVASTAEVDEIDPAFRRVRLHDVVEQMMTRLLLMPTALVIEDAHWLDDASQLIVKRLSQPAARPWLLCVTRRPEQAQITHESGTVVELHALASEDVRALALAVAGDDAVSEERLAAVAGRAGGNPLFVRELVASNDDELPESLETLLTTRLDTLPPEDRLLLRHAAVIGRSFDLDLLADILPDAERGDPDRWRRLSEFVEWRVDDTLAFTHDLLRDAAYAGLSYAVRKEIHGRVAESLERRSAEAAEIAGLLSLHFLEAATFDKAWGYAVAAGDDARGKFANVDAAIFYERALAAAAELTPDPVATAAVAETLGDVFELTARYDRADTAYARAMADVAEPTARARLLRKRGVLCEHLSQYAEARELYDEALTLAGVSDEERVELETAVATVLYRQGKFDECSEWCDRAAERARAASDQRGLAHAYFIRAATENHRHGDPRAYLELALSIYEELGDLVYQGVVLTNMGVPAYYAGDWDEAVRCYSGGRELSARAGDVVRAANATMNLAEVMLEQGRTTEASPLLDDAARSYRAAGFAIGDAVVKLNVGRAEALAGAFHNAYASIEAARAAFETMGADNFALTAATRLAEAYVMEGRHADAASLAHATLERSLATGAGTLTTQLERVLGYAAVQSRLPEQARPHFDESLRIARAADASYEEALTLKALGDTGLGSPDDAATAAAIFERLGVVALPAIPLP